MGGKGKDMTDYSKPGPGAYDPTNSVNKDRTVAYSIPKSIKERDVSPEERQKPGPGNYEAKSTFGSGFKAEVKGRPKERIGNDNPGPGNYESNYSPTKDRIPAYKMGTGQSRADIVSKDQSSKPGPGGYDDGYTFGKDGVKYTIRQKSPDHNKNDTPGPGNYDGNSSAVKDRVPAYKIDGGTNRTNIVSRDQQDRPGPGGYDDGDYFGKNAQKVSIRGKSPDKIGNDNPGPGNYNADPSSVKDRVPAYKMGNGQSRADIVSKDQSNLPGPGGYDDGNNFGKGGISYTIRQKSPEKLDNGLPGPG